AAAVDGGSDGVNEGNRTLVLSLDFFGRVEEGRGNLRLDQSLRFPSPLISRVGDWRAGLGRSLYSLLARSFVCECHTISAVPRFQPPPRRTQCRWTFWCEILDCVFSMAWRNA